MMNKNFIGLCVLMLAFIGTNGCQRAPADLSTAPLAGARIGGDFSLIDQDGRHVSDRDMVGKFRIMYFGYTFCPDACPTDMQQLMAGFRQFERNDPKASAKVQPIFISIDPARDTPARLKTFVNAFHPRLMGLTGTEADVAAVAKRFAVVYQKVPAGNGQYLVDHSRWAMLLGPEGQPIMFLSVGKSTLAGDGTPAKIAGELSTWVR